jgi:hypothetical protein
VIKNVEITGNKILRRKVKKRASGENEDETQKETNLCIFLIDKQYQLCRGKGVFFLKYRVPTLDSS